MGYNFFERKTRWKTSLNKDIAEKLQKQVIEKFKRRKVYARFKDNILAAYLTEMESLYSSNFGFK